MLRPRTSSSPLAPLCPYPYLDENRLDQETRAVQDERSVGGRIAAGPEDVSVVEVEYAGAAGAFADVDEVGKSIDQVKVVVGDKPKVIE
jgi:hypothetical protein